MMGPGVGAPEILILIVLALVVVGPKDLPLMMRKVGRAFGQMRAMAKDFQRQFDALGREAELSELRKEIDALKAANPVREAARELRETDRELRYQLTAPLDDPSEGPKPASAAKKTGAAATPAGAELEADPRPRVEADAS